MRVMSMTKKQLHRIARMRSFDVLKWLRFKLRHRSITELYDATMAQLETIPFGSLE